MPKCNFNRVAYRNHTSAWVFSCKFAAYFQKTFLQEHLWRAASGNINNKRRSTNFDRVIRTFIPFHASDHFLRPMKTGNLWFSDVFRGCSKGAIA